MAAIDTLLRALVEHQMDALLLVPEQLPRLRRGDTEHEVTRTRIDAQRIASLVAEVAPAGSAPAVGAGFEFDYRLDDTSFRFRAKAADPGAWSVEAFAGPAAEQAPAAEANAPTAGEPAAAEPPAATTAAAEISSVVELLALMIDRGASDLHLTVGRRPRIRLHGDLVELEEYLPPATERLERLLFEIAPERNRKEFEQTSDSDFAYGLPGKARFRVNLFRNRGGPAAVFRQIPEKIPTFEELNLPAQLRELAFLSKGLVLVTGPTGSGKSTTLAAIIDLINATRRDHVITIEDPIEFVHRSKKCLINQREVGVHTQSFKRALRAALREDPDIVLVGEMRDLETISIAIETAETGHLVFGTLHTTTAPSTVERVVDQFPGDRQDQIRVMLSESLRAVVAQTLLKRIGGGRVAAFEILICTPAVANLIREGKTFQIPSAMQTGKRQGMVQLTESLVELVEKKVVEPAEAYIKAADKEALVTKLRAAGIDFDPAKLTGSAG